MTPEQYGRLLAAVDQTHDTVQEIRTSQARQWKRIDELSEQVVQHRVWLKVLGAAVGVLALGAGGTVGLLGAVGRVVGAP